MKPYTHVYQKSFERHQPTIKSTKFKTTTMILQNFQKLYSRTSEYQYCQLLIMGSSALPGDRGEEQGHDQRPRHDPGPGDLVEHALGIEAHKGLVRLLPRLPAEPAHAVASGILPELNIFRRQALCHCVSGSRSLNCTIESGLG